MSELSLAEQILEAFAGDNDLPPPPPPLAPRPAQRDVLIAAPGAVPQYFKPGLAFPPANAPPAFLELAEAYVAAWHAFDQVREDAPEEIYGPACEANTAALTALLSYPTTDHALITFKLAVVEDDADSNGPDLDNIIGGFLSCPPLPPPEKCRGAWVAAVRAYRTAKADHDELLREVDRSPSAPAHLLGRTVFGYRNPMRWGTVASLDDDILLAAAAKAALRPALVAHLAERDRLQATPEARAQQVEDEAIYEASYERQSAVENALLAMPAPDAAAVVEKQRLLSVWADDYGFGFADLGLVAHKRDRWLINCPDIVQHVDALLLAGIDDPILHLEPWHPRSWVKAYERQGGYVTAPVWGSALVIVFPDEDHHGVAASLRAELAAAPWKFRAVFHFATHRRGEGADPYIDAEGGYGATDNRGSSHGKERPPAPVLEALRIDWTRENDLPVPHVEHVVNKAAR